MEKKSSRYTAAGSVDGKEVLLYCHGLFSFIVILFRRKCRKRR
jgi:hypothetical protein